MALPRFMPFEAGVSSAGDGMPVTGRLRNLEGKESQRRAAIMAWEHEGAEQAPDALVYAYVDGALRSDATAAEESLPLSFLGAGDSSVQLLTAGASESPPDTLLDPFGQNAMLFWTPSPSPDCAGYNIYSSDTGLLVDEVREVVVQSLVRQAPNSGAGAGRISAWGAVPVGIAVNGLMAVTITAEGAAEWSINGSAAVAFEFVQGSVVALDYGVQLAFHDPVEAYLAADSWNIQVGPRANWTSGALTPGTHTFSVAAVDVAGNESAQVTAAGVYVLDIPGAVGGVVSSYTPGAGDLEVTFTQPAGALGVRVYTNFNPHTGLFEDYVATDGLPYADIAAPAGSWTFNPGAEEGQLLFYLRPYNSECEREDGTLHRFHFPPEPADLGLEITEPTSLAASPLAGGLWRLEWDQLRVPAEASTEFLIYRVEAGQEIDFTAPAVATVQRSSGQGRPARHFVYDHPTPEAFAAVRLAVRASDGSGNTSTNTDWVEVTLDSTAPTLTGPIHGGPA